MNCGECMHGIFCPLFYRVVLAMAYLVVNLRLSSIDQKSGGGSFVRIPNG